MEVNSELGNKIIKGDREAIDTVVDTFCDKAYSFSLYFFGDRGLAEEAVKKSFSAFFANARSLLEESSVPAAYFALLKGWCEKKHDEIKKENGEFFYNLESFSESSEMSLALVKTISELNKKQRSLFLLADLLCLKRRVLCEIYDVEDGAMAEAVSICRGKVIEKLSSLGDFNMKGGN